MKKFYFIISFLVLPIFLTFPQSQFNFNVDFASFRYDSTSNYIEFYYSFPGGQLASVNKDGKNLIEGLLKIHIINSVTNENFLDKKWRIPSLAPDKKATQKEQNLVGMIAFVIPKGSYTCTANGSDNNNSNMSKDYKFSFDVNPYSNSKLKISDIQLASNIKNDGVNQSSIFYKNTLEVIPYPTEIYGKASPVVFYYSEIYNLDKANDFKDLVLVTLVLNNKNQKLFYKRAKVSQNSPAIVKVGAINVSKYQSGKYKLILALSDSVKNFGILSSKEFFVYNPDIKKNVIVSKKTGGLLSSQFAVLSDEECDRIWDASEYISTKNEKDQWDKLHSEKGKREFLFNFWNRKDNNGIVRNTYYTEYFKRVNEASKRFKNLSRDGAKTDMGRVYIMYGEPQQIERFPNQKDTKPYEIWTYEYIEAGVMFVFADLTGFSNYQLIHSTKTDEYQDENWGSRIIQR